MKKRLFKLILFLLVAGAVGVVGFAYLGDLGPEQREIRLPVTLDGR